MSAMSRQARKMNAEFLGTKVLFFVFGSAFVVLLVQLLFHFYDVHCSLVIQRHELCILLSVWRA
jgi:hypothetical protein